MLDLFWDLQQHREIGHAKQDAAEAKEDVAKQSDRILHLERAVGRMALLSQAFWELLRDRLGITEDEFIAKVREIDLRDGKADQRFTPQVATCPKCGRTVNTSKPACFYCGTNIPNQHIFHKG